MPSSILNTATHCSVNSRSLKWAEVCSTNSSSTESSSCPRAAFLPSSTETQHTRCIMLTGQSRVTSWSSWRSFTVTLLWSSARVPLGNTPSRVITTGWSTLKSRAMADTSEGASSEGSDTVTISISPSRPAAGTQRGQRVTAQAHMKFITIPTRWLSFFFS